MPRRWPQRRGPGAARAAGAAAGAGAGGGYQSTLAGAFVREGVGLHSGRPCRVRVGPAPAGAGRLFVRVPPGSLPRPAPAPAPPFGPAAAHQLRLALEAHGRGTRVAEAEAESEAEGDEGTIIEGTLAAVAEWEPRLTTRVGAGAAAVGLTEHLLSALQGCGIDNARIEVEGGPELPILDGSSWEWAAAVCGAGRAEARDAAGARRRREAPRPGRPLTVRRGDAFVALVPAAEPTLTYGIDFAEKAGGEVIGKQWFSWSPGRDCFLAEVAAARTFCCRSDVEALRGMGLIQGGSEENAMVADGARWTNPARLRFPGDEQARHKLLDLVGDLALLGRGGHSGLPCAHVVAYKAGHALHLELAREILRDCGGAAEAAQGSAWARAWAERLAAAVGA